MIRKTGLSQTALSVATIALFSLMALASRTSHLAYRDFSQRTKTDDPDDVRNFVELNDGQKIYGDDINFKEGFFLNQSIVLDGQKYNVKDVKSVRAHSVYFLRYKKDLVKRLVHGPTNVYALYIQKTSNDGHFTSTSMHADYFVQEGENGPLKRIKNFKAIADYVQSCPTAYQMVNQSKSQIIKHIKTDPEYLNEVFETYNQCR